jgi:pyruvate/2-oxoglutarate dehydrogenase complex dihydrolipoamide dehydrogenase (E3) component
MFLGRLDLSSERTFGQCRGTARAKRAASGPCDRRPRHAARSRRVGRNVTTHRYDLVVVGAGSGGYAAARTARDLGASVALVDHGPLGGLCILAGCMPSKTLLATSDLVHEIRESSALGVDVGAPQVDIARMLERKKKIIAGFADYRTESLRSFPLFEGVARFLSPYALQVGDDLVLEASWFVVATGSVVAPAAVPGLAEAGFIDSDAALDLSAPPASLLVLGGGYVACELGQFFARIGVDTTILIRSAQLLSQEDRDVGEALTLYFRAEGMRVEASAQVTSVEVREGKKVVHFQRGEADGEIAADEIFYALGRVPNVAGLNLEQAGVRYHPVTGIEVTPSLRTSAPNIFAVGDVTGEYPLVHVAIYQGELAARNAIGQTNEPADYSLQKTHTIFTDPQVAIAGATEKELERNGTPYVVSSYLFADHGKAISIGKTKGFVKMLAAPGDGRILGAAIVGPEASDLIHEIVVALFYGATVYDFVRIPHLHPTLAEILTYPAEDIVSQLTPASPAPVAAAV